MEIVIMRFAPYQNLTSRTVGFAGVKIKTTEMELVINDMMLVKGDKGYFACLPHKKSQKDDKYYPTIVVDDSTFTKLNEMLVACYKPHLVQDWPKQ